MDYNTPGFSVVQYFLEFAQTHVHWLNAIQISQTLLPPSPPALNLSQNQGLSIISSAFSLLYGPPLTSVHDSQKNHIFDRIYLCWQSDSLLFNIQSRLVIDFLQRSKCLFISWLQSPFIVILESEKIKSVTISTFSPSICHEGMESDSMVLDFLNVEF